MAQTIKLKRSGTSGNIPTTSQLELGEVAINTYDGKMFIKKNVGGTESIVEISAAAADAILVEYQFTSTATQTTYSGSDDNSETLSYTPNAIQVFMNGILLDPGIDFTATNGTSIVLSEAADANDYLQIFAFKKKIGDGSVSVDTFTGDDSTTAFTLSVDPGDENNTRVFIDGVYQSKSNYSVSGTTLTFSTAPPTGTAVEVEIGNRVVTLDTLSDLDLPDDVKLRLGTSQDLQIYHDSSHSIVADVGTGDLLLRGNNARLQNSDGSQSFVHGFNNGAVEIFHSGNKKFETTSSGIDVNGTAVADALSVDSITIDGTEIDSSSSLMLDIAGNLTVNVDGTTVTLADDAINFGQFYNNASGQFNIYAPTQDKDIVFLGNDGGSTITALTLDMSNAGKASFNHDIAVGGSLSITDSGQAQFGTGNDMQIYHNGAVGEINNNTGTFTIDSADDIILDAAGNDVVLKDNGTTFGQLTNDSGNLVIYNSGSQMLKGLGVGSNAQFMGNLGIGASPATGAKLHLSSTAGAPIYIEDSNATSTFNITELSNNGANFGLQTRNSSGAFVSTDYQIVKNANGADYHRWFTAGSERMRIDSSGNLLVGLSSSLTNGKLQIAGGIGLSGNTQIRQATNSDGNTLQVFATQLIAGSNNSSSYNYTGGGLLAGLSNLDSAVILDAGRQTSTGGRFKVVTTSSSNTSLYLEKNGTYTLYADTGSGNVGIGTTSPAFITGSGLEVQRDGVATLRLEDTGSSGKALELSIDDATGAIINSGSSGLPMIFKVINSEAMRLDTSGRLLVGRTASASDANADDVQIGNTSGAHGLTILSQNSHNGNIYFADNDNNDAGRLIYNHTNNRMEFYTNRSQSMVITSAGNVGIGTNSAAQHFEVNKASARMRLTDGTDQINFGLWDGTNYRLEGDANRKILITSYHTDGIHLGTTGGSHMVVKGGNVTIGADNPLTTGGIAKLSVIGILSFGLTNSDMSYIRRQSAGNYAWQTYDNDNTGSIQLQPYGGNVGIGTTNPQHKLHFGSAYDEVIVLDDARTSSNAATTFTSSIVWDGYYDSAARIAFEHNDYNVTNRKLKFQVSATTPGTYNDGIVLQQNGNVGIRIGSPNVNLEVQGSSASTYSGSGPGATILASQGTDGNWIASNVNGKFAYFGIDGNDGKFAAYNYATNTEMGMVLGQSRMYIKNDGNVGIGNTNPNYKLDIIGNINIAGAGAYLRWQSGDMQIKNEGSYKMGFYTYNSSDGTLNRRMVIDTNGNVGIGTTSPAAPLHVSKDLDSGGNILQLTNADSTYNQHLYVKFNSSKDIEFEGASGNGGIIMDPGSRGTRFQISSVDIGRFDSDGLRLEAGKGIKFSAHASTNVLDDYEEGTWTPGIEGASSGSLTMGSQNVGFYTKVGNTIHVCGTIHVSATTTLTGSLKLTGLPFVTKNVTGYRSNAAPVTNTMLSLPNSSYTVGIGVDANLTYAWIVGKDDYGKNYTHTPGQFSTGFFYGFSMTYETN